MWVGKVEHVLGKWPVCSNSYFGAASADARITQLPAVEPQTTWPAAMGRLRKLADLWGRGGHPHSANFRTRPRTVISPHARSDILASVSVRNRPTNPQCIALLGVWCSARAAASTQMRTKSTSIVLDSSMISLLPRIQRLGRPPVHSVGLLGRSSAGKRQSRQSRITWLLEVSQP